MLRRRNFPRFRREDSEEMVLRGVVGILGALRGYAGDAEDDRAFVYAVTLALRYVAELPPEGEERAETVAIAERVGRMLRPNKKQEEAYRPPPMASVVCMAGWRPKASSAAPPRRSSGDQGPGPRAA